LGCYRLAWRRRSDADGKLYRDHDHEYVYLCRTIDHRLHLS
jgi:hypothetical protein